jgi:hypothetical protein
MFTVVPDGCPGHDGGKGQDRWRAINDPHLVALFRAGAVFRDGALIEHPEPAAA